MRGRTKTPVVISLVVTAAMGLGLTACSSKYSLADLAAAKQEMEKQTGAAAAKRQSDAAFEKLDQE
jgi:putative hemolysin